MLVEVMLKKNEIRGILLPETQNKLSNIAIVLAVGPGRTYPNGATMPMDIKVGDKIYIGNLGRCEFVKNDENKYLFMVPEPLVEGIVEEDEDVVTDPNIDGGVTGATCCCGGCGEQP